MSCFLGYVLNGPTRRPRAFDVLAEPLRERHPRPTDGRTPELHLVQLALVEPELLLDRLVEPELLLVELQLREQQAELLAFSLDRFGVRELLPRERRRQHA